MATIIIKSEHSEIKVDSNHLISLIQEGLDEIHERAMNFPGDTWEFTLAGVDNPEKMVHAAQNALVGLEFDHDTIEAGRAIIRTIQPHAERSDDQPF